MIYRQRFTHSCLAAMLAVVSPPVYSQSLTEHRSLISIGSTPREAPPSFGLQLPGVAKPETSAILRSVVPGIVQEVHVEEGQAISKGDVLVSLDGRLMRAQLKIAELQAKQIGDMQRAQSLLDAGEKRLARLEIVYQRNAISVSEIEEQRAAVDQARAIYQGQVEARELARANLVIAQERLRQLAVFAPFDGIVTKLHIKLGASIDPSTLR